MITQVTVHIEDWVNWGKERRVAVAWTDNEGHLHEGCYHYTGNPYIEKGKMENLTPEVLIDAIRLAVYPNDEGRMVWHDLSSDDCRRRYAELEALPQAEANDILTEFLESARYTGS